MKRPKQKPRHNVIQTPPADAEIEHGEEELFDFMEALPVSADPDTVKPLHRDSDFDTMHPAETLAVFLDFCFNVRQRYQGNLQVQDDTNLETQDLLHYMELSENLRVAEGFKVYRRMREVRRVRRDAKNENDLLQPLYDFLTQTDFENTLRRVLGNTRTRAEVVGKRQYGMRTDILTRGET